MGSSMATQTKRDHDNAAGRAHTERSREFYDPPNVSSVADRLPGVESTLTPRFVSATRGEDLIEIGIGGPLLFGCQYRATTPWVQAVNTTVILALWVCWFATIGIPLTLFGHILTVFENS